MFRWSSNRPEHHLPRLGICGIIYLVAVAPALGATLDCVYSGKRVLIEGSDPTCPAEDDVLVTIHGDMLTFTNSALQDFLMTFSPHQDGSFSQIYVDAG